MFPSYNHNITYAGNTFHVQTEMSVARDGGDPHVVTHVFLAGDVIATRRAVVAAQDNAQAHTLTMQKQHQDAMRALIGGQHDATLKARGINLQDHR